MAVFQRCILAETAETRDFASLRPLPAKRAQGRQHLPATRLAAHRQAGGSTEHENITLKGARVMVN